VDDEKMTLFSHPLAWDTTQSVDGQSGHWQTIDSDNLIIISSSPPAAISVITFLLIQISSSRRPYRRKQKNTISSTTRWAGRMSTQHKHNIFTISISQVDERASEIQEICTIITS